MRHPDAQDKVIAKAILRNTNIDPETRVKLARGFDPSIKSVNDGLYEEQRGYEESIVHSQVGRAPEAKNEMHIVPSVDGGLEAIFTKNGQFVRSQKLNNKNGLEQ